MVADRRAPRMTMEQWRALERTGEVTHEHLDTLFRRVSVPETRSE